ncbi:hypothetical protein HC766_07550 [Candidatus Gracilibacteria bacterium]|nr:hypothetical protein [Candidatus Gracilibacteria bacterium]
MSNLTFLISQLAASSITLFVITRLNIKEGISNKNYDTSQIKKILPKKLKIWKNNSSLDYQLQSRFGIKLDKEIYFPYYCLFLVINYKKLGDNYYSYLNICGSEQIFEYYVEISKYEKELEKIIAKERFKFKYLDSFKDIYYFGNHILLNMIVKLHIFTIRLN